MTPSRLRRKCIDLRILVCIPTLLTASGCWQEIEYKGPDPVGSTQTAITASNPLEELPPESQTGPPLATDVPPTNPQSDVTDEATGFAEDLADSLASPADDSSDAPTPTTSAADDPAATSPLVGDRYAASTTEIAADDMPPATSDPVESTPAPEGQLPLEPPVEEQTAADTPAAESAEIASEQIEPPVDTLAIDSPAPDAAVAPVTNTKLNAWLLGSRLSLAALANDRRSTSENIQKWLAESKSVAASLKTAVADLPEPGPSEGEGTASRRVLNYLVIQGQQIGRDLTNKHGPSHAALFEVALKSNLLLVLYVPRSSSTDAIATAINKAAPLAQLPADLWRPLLDMLANRAEPVNVRRAVVNFHKEVERHLAGRAEP
jgi:hypothetical protein